MTSKRHQILKAFISEPKTDLEPGEIITEFDIICLWAFHSEFNNHGKKPSRGSPQYENVAKVADIIITHWKTLDSSIELNRRSVIKKIEQLISKQIEPLLRNTRKLQEKDFADWIKSEREKYQIVFNPDPELVPKTAKRKLSFEVKSVQK